MKTFSATPADIDKKWILIDAEGVVAGPPRLDRRHAPARQAQAIVHASYGHGRQRHRHQRRQDPDDRQEARREELSTGTLVTRAASSRRTAGQILEGAHPERVVTQGRQAHAAGQPPEPSGYDQPARLCRCRASA